MCIFFLNMEMMIRERGALLYYLSSNRSKYAGSLFPEQAITRFSAETEGKYGGEKKEHTD